jgi:hypothetical protein
MKEVMKEGFGKCEDCLIAMKREFVVISIMCSSLKNIRDETKWLEQIDDIKNQLNNILETTDASPCGEGMYLETANLLKKWFDIIEGIKDERDEWDLIKKRNMFYLIVCYKDLKGNVEEDLKDIISTYPTYEEAKEMWSSFIENNSTEYYFDREGYNYFYIGEEIDDDEGNDDEEIRDAFETGYFEEGHFKCVDGEWIANIMFSLKVCYNDLKGNVGDCEIISTYPTYEEAKEMWSSFIKNNSTEDYFNMEGYNCFYIESVFEGEVLDIKDDFDTGYFEEGHFECIDGEWYNDDEVNSLLKEDECE